MTHDVALCGCRLNSTLAVLGEQQAKLQQLKELEGQQKSLKEQLAYLENTQGDISDLLAGLGTDRFKHHWGAFSNSVVAQGHWL